MSKVKKFTNLGDHLPIWHFDENLMVFNDGSLGGGLKISGLDISTATHEVVNQFCQQVSNLLNTMEEGLRLQIFYRLSSDVSELIDRHALEMKDTAEEYRPLVDARLSFLRKNQKLGNFYSPEIYLFLRGKAQKIKHDSFFKPLEKYPQMIEEDYQEHRDQFLRAFEQVKDHLEGLNLMPTILHKEEWHKLIFDYFNFERMESIGHPALRETSDEFAPSLLEQSLLSDVLIHEDSVQVGSYHFRFINLGLLPDKTIASMADALTKMPFHYWISVNFIRILPTFFI